MQRIPHFILPLLLCLIQYIATAQPNGRLSGRVVDRATQSPLVGISVNLQGSAMGRITDSMGNFSFSGLEIKSYNIDFSGVGYKPQALFNIVIGAGNEVNLNIELEPVISSLSEVVIRSNRRTAEAATIETPLSVQRLTTEEIRSNPGGNFDISKVIQALPGVGGGIGGGGFRNDIIIRGGAPNENVFYLDGIEIPVINHFQTQGSSGGPQGMLNVSFIEDVKLSSSAFEARYDNALSSVFQFRQRSGNPNRLQGNVRLSATDVSATLEGPLSRNKKTTFLASARRSYLQLLFSVIDLPIRPNYWDFQTKVTHKLNDKTTLSFMGLGAIDEFSFAKIKDATPEKLYVLNSNPFINQWNYTAGFTLRRLVKDGFINLALSRNTFDNNIQQYEDNETRLAEDQTLDYRSHETENKFRIDVNKFRNGWKWAYGASVQLAEYDNKTFSVLRRQLRNDSGNVIQPAEVLNFDSPLKNFWRFGAFAQLSKSFFNSRLGVSAGLRSDMNTFTTEGNDPFKTLSPRISFSYVLAERWTANASIGRYYKIPPYTILGFADNSGIAVNKNADYLRNDHYVTGVEFLASKALRFTAEVFYKDYDNVPVSVRDGISLSNLGSDFNVLGNEAVITNGKGYAYGFEFFAQQKLTKKFFGVLSYTYYRSEYSGNNGIFIPSSWDNRHLLSATMGYKLPRNWELGLKFRFQGGAPYTPFDERASQLNYISRGSGILDYSKLNTLRLRNFHSSDIRLDKKWNFRKTTIDLFLDITNWYRAKSSEPDSYTFKRNADNTGFETTDGSPIKADGSNGIPVRIGNDDASFVPSIGLIVEF
ncbi:MAG: TonB-dependent receptor [Chitinophagaceae bacterium]|nr:MAG: TonB-dependent receptor [Chitinophagaceae bacterium]